MTLGMGGADMLIEPRHDRLDQQSLVSRPITAPTSASGSPISIEVSPFVEEIVRVVAAASIGKDRGCHVCAARAERGFLRDSVFFSGLCTYVLQPEAASKRFVV
jgi:hypothetical protein